MRILSMVLCFAAVLLAGCGQKTAQVDIPRPASYSEPLPAVTQLQGKSIIVLSPLSLKAVMKLNSEQMLAKYKKSRQAEGEEYVPLLDIHLINNAPTILSIGARYPYLVADALSRGGASAQPGDALELPADAFKNASSDDVRAKLREMGYDYILTVGLERAVEKGEKIYTRKEHYGKSLAGEVLTLGLNPVKTHTYGVRYARDYELQSTSPGSRSITFVLETNYSYDETKNILSGFTYGQAMMRDSEEAQLREVPEALRKLNGLDLGGL